MSFIEQPEQKPPTFEPETEKSSLMSQIKEFVWETLKVVIISLLIIVPVRYFLIQPFYVKGASMEPSFYDHEYLIVDEISYRMGDPKRGDVVVFRYPEDRSQFFIKRVIGLPFETVVIKDGGITIKNQDNQEGFILNEELYLSNTYTQGTVDITLKAGEYYLLGDNRTSSLDSRVFGTVSRSDLIGRAWFRGWPLNRVDVFSEPTY